MKEFNLAKPTGLVTLVRARGAQTVAGSEAARNSENEEPAPCSSMSSRRRFRVRLATLEVGDDI